MIELLQRLCMASGVSGDESKVAEIIEIEAQPFCDKISRDNMGNLYVYKKGLHTEKTIMVAAHMDEVGFIVKHVRKDGLIKCEPVGGIDPRILIGRTVKIVNKGVCGVVATKAVHLSNENEKNSAPSFDELFIDIGAQSEKQAKKHVELGDIAVFDSSFECFGDDMIKCKSLDNRVGCTVALEAIKQQPYFNTVFVFTVQEEMGLRGAYAAAYEIKPDLAIVVDTTTAADLPDVSPHEKGCLLKKGAVIFMLDNVTYYKKETVMRAVNCAQKIGVGYQIKNLVTGGVDAGAIQRSESGIEVLTIATPCRYLHSPSSVAHITDIIDTKNLLTALLVDETFLKG